MKKLFVFAIGGTGERVLRSLTMVLAAGVPAFDDYDIYPIVIDYDAQSGDKKRAMECLNTYKALHDSAYAAHARDGNHFFGADIKEVNGLNKYVLEFAPGNGQEKFKDYVGYATLGGKTNNTKVFLDSMYDNSTNPTTELNLDMTVGFKGNPNIGSVVFHKLKDHVVFNTFTNLYRSNQGDKVVIIGSLFGGTGASGIPELVQAIDASVVNPIISTVLVMPYFSPMKQDGGAINANIFNAKTKAAINYYKQSGLISKISAVYYLGDIHPTPVAYCDGGANQCNNANIVELLSAFAIEHFLKLPQPPTNKEFKFFINASMDTPRFFIHDFDAATKLNIFKYMTAFALMMKYFHDQIVPGMHKVSYFDLLGLDKFDRTKVSLNNSNRVQDICGGLNHFYELFKRWISELDYEGDADKHILANTHRLATYVLTNDYHKIVVDKAVATSQLSREGVVDRIRSSWGNRNLPDADFIKAHLNDALNMHHSNNKWSTKEFEYAFMDILHKVALEAEVELHNQ